MSFYVYFIQRGPFIKIGYSNDPEGRLRSLQTGNASKCHLIAKFPFRSELEARDMESYLHKKCAGMRRMGEWFDGPQLLEYIHRELSAYVDPARSAELQEKLGTTEFKRVEKNLVRKVVHKRSQAHKRKAMRAPTVKAMPPELIRKLGL